MRAHCKTFFIVPVLLGTALAACAQTEDCSLDGSNPKAVFTPIMQGKYADSELLYGLKRGYARALLELEPEQGKVILVQALEEARAKRNRCAEGLAEFGLAQIANKIQLAEAMPHLRKAEAALEETNSPLALAFTRNRIVLTQIRTRDKELTLEKANASADELDRVGQKAMAIFTRFIVQHDFAFSISTDEAYADYRKQLQAVPGLVSADEEARILFYWAQLAYARNDHQKAISLLQQAAALFEKCDCDLGTQAAVQIVYALIDNNDRLPKEALEHAFAAQKLYDLAHEKNPQALEFISQSYYMEDNRRAAEDYGEKALALARQQNMRQYIGQFAGQLGMVYLDDDQPERGIALLEEAVQVNPQDYYVQQLLSWGYDVTRQWTKADAAATRSIDLGTKAEGWNVVLRSYVQRAQARAQLGRLEEALDDVREAQALTEDVRAKATPDDTRRQGRYELLRFTSDVEIAILTRMGRTEEALMVAEQARGRAFQDLLSSPHTKLSDAARSRMLAASAGEAPALASRGGTLTAGDHATVLKSTAHAAALDSRAFLATVDRLKSTVVAYWYTTDSLFPQATLYTWVVSPGKPVYGIAQTIERDTMETLVSRVQPFAGESTRGGTIPTRGGGRLVLSEKNRGDWRRLYDLLIAPIADHLPQEPGSLLTIVPNRELFQVAFAALPDAAGHYLVEKHALHTVSAVGLLRYTEENDKAASALAPHTLLVANPTRLPRLADGKALPPLPATETEAREIARLYPVGQVTVLDGDKASISELETKAPEATVLHFATHAIVSNSDPLASFLALNRGKSEDGELTAADAYNLNLHAKLVVLSACRTGLGKISGDGVDGLNRAFFYSGSASVLSTLWDVADEPTSELLVRFYRSLNAGQSRSAALRQAQLAMLDDLRRGKVAVHTPQGRITLPENPAFWAAFSLAGEP